jgi:amino acid adenylation domain-containing protein
MQQSFSKYPASAAQKQFWLIHQLHPESSAYNLTWLFRIKGRLNQDALEKTINKIVTCHEVYRTTFFSENGELYQHVADKSQISIQVSDFSSLSGNQQKVTVKQFIDEAICRPFNLTNGPLLRVVLIHLAGNENIILIIMHHIITDLRSQDLFSKEFSTLYNGWSVNKPDDLNEPDHKYSDYVYWQKEWLLGDECNKMIANWEKELKDKDEYLNLPIDRRRSNVQNLKGAFCPLSFSRKFTKDLQEFSSLRNVNNYLTLLSAYLVLLFRYSNQNDITIGVPLTNRRQEAHKNIQGSFVNILPLSFNVSSDMSFNEIIKLVRTKMLFAHRNQEAPYELLVRELQPKRDLSYNPLFQVGFTFEHPMELDLHKLEVKSEKIHNQGAQLDIFFTFFERSGEIHGYIEYNTDLFEPDTITRLADHYKTFLKKITLDSSTAIASIPILSESEYQQNLMEWNNTQKSLPEPFFHKLFEKQVEKTPDSVAVVYKEKSLTYREINERANQLANHLLKLGAKPELLIGVFIERSMEMMIALLGILKAGAAYVPLDPDFPVERLAYMLDASDINILITLSDLLDPFPGDNINKIYLDRDWPHIKKQPVLNPSCELTPDNLAYVIFTSGSTGKPKGVQIPHEALVNFLISMREKPGLTQSDIMVAITTLSFDISGLELFLPLIVGAKIVIASRDTAANGEELLQLINMSNATIMQATPTTWYLLLAAGWHGNKDFKILCGGEAMPQDLALKLTQCSANVWNMYGPTETTIWSTCYQITDGNKPVLIGKAIDNTQIYIVNNNLQHNPVGIAGEMLIGGTGVSRGYLNRPELTKERFIPDHFSGKSGNLLYRTGDLACYLPDGNIKIFSRLDNQIKLRGYRIELGEIETILAKHPSVDTAVVIVREDDINDKRLVAYVTIRNGFDYNLEELRQHLKTLLPQYMIPSIFVRLTEIPLTLNGKIDRKNLPRTEQKRSDLSQNYIQPKSETEQLLSGLWNEVLKIDRVGINDNFFDLGGNSLLCVQLVERIKSKTDINIPIVKLFQYPTISALAEYINNKQIPRNTPNKFQNRVNLQKEALAQFRRRKID